MKKVLIFDDDKDILELCSIILGTKGFNVAGEISCSNLILKVKQANPDVILMDNWIPDIGGVEATRLLKQIPETNIIPIIFFTANNNVESLSHEAGADYFLQKPFDINEFINLVQSASTRSAVNGFMNEQLKAG